MSLLNTFSQYNHFSELATPLPTNTGVISAATRRATALQNLFGTSATGILDIGASTVAGTVAGATVVAEEHGDGRWHQTKLTLTNFIVGEGADNASLGIGNKVYTFPSGTILVDAASLSMVGALSTTLSSTAQTPEVGIGSVVASGAVAVLSGTATFEEYVDGNASGAAGGDTLPADLAGTAFYKTGRTTPVLIKTSGGKSHDIFLNAAVAWADVTAAANVLYTGVICFRWMKAN